MIQIGRWGSSRAAAALTAVTFLVYGNSLLNGFAFDDVPIILRNPPVRHPFRYDVLLRPYWPDYGRQLGLYRPLTLLSYSAQLAAVGASGWLFHLVNLLLHTLVVVLLFLVLRKLVPQTAAFVGALVFAVHPLHVEAVANIVGQAELAAAAAVLGACLLAMNRPADGAYGPGRLLGMAGLYALAVGFKESAIIAPALLPLLDMGQRRFPLRRNDFAGYIRTLAPLALVLGAVAAGYLGLRQHVLGSFAGRDAAPYLPFLREHHLLMAFRAWPEYVRLLFFPLDLSADYSPAVILPLTSLSPVAALGLFLLLTTTALALLAPWRPQLGLAAAWFLVANFVTSNLLVPVGIVVAERTLYLPSVAIAIIAAYAAEGAIRRYHSPAAHMRLAVLAAAVAGLLGVRSAVRNPVWRDSDSITEALLRDAPQSYRAQWFGATAAFARHDTIGADSLFLLAHSIWSQDAAFLNAYATFEAARLRYDRAEEMLRRGLAYKPDASALHETLARVYLKTARYPQGLAQVDSALAFYRTPALQDLRARAMFGLGRYREAAAVWSLALSEPGAGGWDSWMGYSRARALSGETAAALAALDTARVRARGDTTALRRIAEVRSLTLQSATAARRPAPPQPRARQP